MSKRFNSGARSRRAAFLTSLALIFSTGDRSGMDEVSSAWP